MTRSEPPPAASDPPRAFFGRRTGRKLHPGQKQRLDRMLPALVVEPGPEGVDPRALFPGKRGTILEIGFGGGEHLARQAAQNPDLGFIGCEVFSGGIAKLVTAIEAAGLDNVRIFTEDALGLLVALPPASLDGVYLLYPDPWPKRRHHKRRFVSPASLDALARTLKPGAWLRFATDIEDYANWTLAHVLRKPQFRFLPGGPGSWHQPYPAWKPTRYEQKARREGRTRSFYFHFERV